MPVERSQSLRPGDLSRVDSPSLRPKVSFNRAVHIKRISRRLADVVEDEDSPDYSDGMTQNGFPTLPRRAPTPLVNGKGGKGPEPSERLSRLIRHDPLPEEGKPPTTPQTKLKKKKSLSERVRNMFTSKSKKTTEEDELKSRYTEFKGRNSSSDATDNEADTKYSTKRRGSAPETRASWFRSIDRLKKNEPRKERFFGESDAESSRTRHIRVHVDSSADSATEQEGMSRAPSLVYLHTAAVGDIPHRATTPTKRLTRSVSVLAPWAPKLRPPQSRNTRSRATQTDGSTRQEFSTLRPPPRQHRSLPKLVFTGPSIENTIGRSTLQRTNGQMRSRK